GHSQILLNYARVSRGPWRLKALIDKSGHPVNSRFLVFRSKSSYPSLRVLWAVCNSPVANAYAYCHSTKRDILVGTLRQLPVPLFGDGPFEALEAAVETYFNAVKGTRALTKRAKPSPKISNEQMSLSLLEGQKSSKTGEEDLKHLHWRIDA